MSDFQVQALPSSNVSIIIVKHNNKFCCTDEPEGWFLPAGMVDVGESFSSAALRETMEEAGLDVSLTGIMRLEYNYSSNMIRFRCLYSGVPVDPDRPLKEEADEESFGAAYLSLEEVEGLGRRNPEAVEKIKSLPYRQKQDKRKGEKLRSGFLIKVFKWASTKTKSFDLRILRTVDGVVDRNPKAKSKSVFSVGLVLYNQTSKLYLLSKSSSGSLSLPIKFMEAVGDVKTLGEELLDETFEKALTHKFNQKQKAKFSFSSPKRPKLSGICGVLHEAAQSKNGISKTHVTFYSCCKGTNVVVPKKKESHEGDVCWLSAEDIRESDQVGKECKRVIGNHTMKVIAPMNFLALENSSYICLS